MTHSMTTSRIEITRDSDAFPSRLPFIFKIARQTTPGTGNRSRGARDGRRNDGAPTGSRGMNTIPFFLDTEISVTQKPFAGGSQWRSDTMRAAIASDLVYTAPDEAARIAGV